MREIGHRSSWGDWLRIGRLVPLVTIVVALAVGIMSLLGLFQATLTEGIIISLLALLALDALVERLSLMEKFSIRLSDLHDLVKLKQSGVSKVYLMPEEIGNEGQLINLIKETKSRIDFQGLTLGYLATNSRILDALRKEIIAGVKVRVIMMSPDNPLINGIPNFKYFEFPEDLKTLSRTCANKFRRFKRELEKTKTRRGQFDLVLCKTRPISMALRRFDNKVYVLHYVSNKNTIETPVYLIKEEENRDLFEAYLESFERQFSDLRQSD